MKIMSKSLITSSPSYHFTPNCCIILIITAFLVPTLCGSEITNLKNFTSCLVNHHINNFTLYSSNNGPYLLNFSLQNLRFSDSSDPKPQAIILPESKEQLANIVLCSRKWSFEMRIRSGGHSYEGISSSVPSNGTSVLFVVIDMMNLDRVSVDLDLETAWVEGGATLGQVYHAIAESSSIHGFPAGACPTVGVGGHFSGGGFGVLSRKYGVAADNVVDALLVDAEGRLLDREGMGDDVFWALCGGGGGNWGIVYAWKIKLVQVPDTVTAFTVSRLGGADYSVADIVHIWQHVAPKLDNKFHLMVFVSAGLLPSTKGVAAIFQGLYQGPRIEAISMLNASFPELRVVEEELKEMSWIQSVVYLSDFNGGQGVSILDLKDRYFRGKSYFKTKSDYVHNPISSTGIDVVVQKLKKQPQGYVLFEPYGHGFMENASSESIAFPHRRGNIFSIEYTVTWQEVDNVDSKKYIDWIRRFYDLMTPYVSSNPRGAYVNYMDLDLGVMKMSSSNDTSSSVTSAVEMARVWGEKYFMKNYDRLVKAKTLIDPYNVFRHQQSIPPISFIGARATARI